MQWWCIPSWYAFTDTVITRAQNVLSRTCHGEMAHPDRRRDYICSCKRWCDIYLFILPCQNKKINNWKMWKRALKRVIIIHQWDSPNIFERSKLWRELYVRFMWWCQNENGANITYPLMYWWTVRIKRFSCIWLQFTSKCILCPLLRISFCLCISVDSIIGCVTRIVILTYWNSAMVNIFDFFL